MTGHIQAMTTWCLHHIPSAALASQHFGSVQQLSVVPIAQVSREQMFRHRNGMLLQIAAGR
jgi:hypothetical protein